MRDTILTYDKVHRAICNYGVYPALLLLKQLEGEEKYESCYVIKKVLCDLGQVSSDEIIDLDDDSLNKYYMNLPPTTKSNMRYYIKDFKELLEIR